MKAAVIHAVHWNPQRYLMAAGYPGGAGYVQIKGYGHEEWNNNPNWKWRDPRSKIEQRLFFTQAYSEKLDEFVSSANELAIAMVASHERRKDLVGIACGVTVVDADERDAIAERLGLRSQYKKAWVEVSKLRTFFNDDRQRFERQIHRDRDFFRWMVPVRLFRWFSNPVPIRSTDLLDDAEITHRFGGSQGVDPNRLLRVLRPHLPSNSPILSWLTHGEFSDAFVSSHERSRKTKTGRPIGSNAPTKRGFRVKRINSEYEVFPHHDKLQGAFIRWMGREHPRVEVTPNWRFVDVRLGHSASKVSFVEVKPCDRTDVRYAVREAIGQLLEYRHRLDPTARLVVVLGAEPEHESLTLLKSLGIGALWKNGHRFQGALR